MDDLGRQEVTEALDLAIEVLVSKQRQPRITSFQYGALVSLQTVAIILGLEEMNRRVAGLLDEDGERLKREIWRGL